MPDKVIVNVDQVTSEWLTAVLTGSGALTLGIVTSFELDTGQGNWSRSANLAIRYSEEARGLLPQRLFLKMVNTVEFAANESFGESEVSYYMRDYVGVKNAPLLRCYDAVYSKELNWYHILLDDVSETPIEAAQKDPRLNMDWPWQRGRLSSTCWWGAQRFVKVGAQIHSARHIQPKRSFTI